MSNHDMIRKVMKRKKNWRNYEVHSAVCELRNKLGMRMVSPSNIERRMREMEDVISLRPRNVRLSTAWTYQLIK